ncbi:hypothetical protein ABID82_003481 [Methylobacterium sp. PvP062]|jgi:hypothetical protein|uniref:Uncharacterized protein n=1 Tax=Methylobacterium radiotolerans TaxID=31998 RepID=A0ABV2NCR3_9HYPH|nr:MULTISPECIES: hypothetical protein [unclassified Methylobacterium]MBP2492481.1 hypothetical protein [Methylobacterium sp. PvP105]MBP2501148.1 hypothetical protein [Methylobacterium sp. PvP109]MCX7333414.1 hypothetical protein [Hyphomicrobiales bacterium]
MNRFLTSVVEAALGFGAAVPLIVDPSGDPPASSNTGTPETGANAIRA